MLTLRGIIICIALISIQLNVLSQPTNAILNHKISPLLQSRLASVQDQKIEVVLIVAKDYAEVLERKDILASAHRGNRLLLTCLLSKPQILALAEMSDVKFIELWRKPETESKQEGLDLTLNEVRYLQNSFTSWTGRDMNISIKENLFDTNDIDFKNRIIALELASSHIDMHATNMASIAAGGGNSSPTAKGVAWDANISSSDFSNLFPDPDNYFIDHNISVQNHAYGTGIENYYGAESVAYDEQIVTIPWLLHVFSSGNIGDQSSADGKYKGLQGWANLTGQFKQSKNTITTGATDSMNNVVVLSSRGPAYDGRIKPEVVAYGHGGSSGAAAIVSGVSLLMQQAFLKTTGYLPPSSLIRAALINSTLDIHTSGPDFISGFGGIRALEAVESILLGRYYVGSITPDEIIRLGVNVIEGAAFNITLAWEDPPGEVLSPKALVNDLDITLENTDSGELWYPWVLNTAASIDSLQLPAKTGIDTLNNVEKITLLSSKPGDYILNIRAKNLKTSSQQYSVIWHNNLQEIFAFTFPGQKDYLVPGARNIIRWAPTKTVMGSLHYRIDNGPWVLMKDSINSADLYYKWDAPDVHGLVQLKWSSSISNRESDIFPMTNPPEPKVALLCPDSLIINWTDHAHSDSFEIFKLGDRHLERYQFVQDTFFIEYDPDPQNPYYAVAPWFGDLQGPLSYAFDFTKQAGGCFIDAFYFLHVLNDKAFFGANLSGIEQIGRVIFEEKINGVFVPLQSVDHIDSTTLFFASNVLKQGINDFRLRIILNDGREIISQEERVYFNKNNAVLLFPNPVRAGEELSLLVKDIDEFDILILDIQGKVIFRFNDLESPVVLPPLNLLPGIYIYKIVSPQGDVHGKILVY